MEVMGKIPQALRVNRVCGGFLDMEKIREVWDDSQISDWWNLDGGIFPG
jgi:hypothetical protein